MTLIVVSLLERTMANWFYVAGSLCFLIGTIINMIHPPIKISDFPRYQQQTPEDAARGVPLHKGALNG